MKFKAVIIESVEVKGDVVVIYFEGDKAKQHFEIKCEFNAFELGIRKWEVWEFYIKFKSEIFEDSKTKVKSYFTHLVCYKATPVHEVGNK